MPEPIDIPATVRAHYDRELAAAIDGLLVQAAQRDDLDVIEANADLATWLSDHMSHRQLATAAAALAIRLRRITEGAW